MLRIASRNILIMVGVALPVMLVSTDVVGWLSDLKAGRNRGTAGPSLTDLLLGFELLYVMWLLPALAIATIHQLLLAALPHDWPTRTMRRVILATSLGIGGAVAGYVAFETTLMRGFELALALLPAALAYGALAQPLRPVGATESLDGAA